MRASNRWLLVLAVLTAFLHAWLTVLAVTVTDCHDATAQFLGGVTLSSRGIRGDVMAGRCLKCFNLQPYCTCSETEPTSVNSTMMHPEGEQESVVEARGLKEDAPTPGPADGSEVQATRRPPPVASPADILASLSTVVDELEAVWTDALRTDQATQAREKALEVWSSFRATLRQWLASTEGLLKELGLTTLAATFPLKEEELTRLELDPPNPRKRLQQLQVAQFYVLQDLFDALDALREPLGRRRIEIVAGRVVESWWESGAFAMVRSRSRALEAVLRAQQECIDQLAEDAGAIATSPIASLSKEPTWVYQLRIASELISRGNHEASIPVLLQALRALLASAAKVPGLNFPRP